MPIKKLNTSKELALYSKIMAALFVIAIIFHVALICTFFVYPQTLSIIKTVVTGLNKLFEVLYVLVLPAGGAIVAMITVLKKFKSIPIIQWVIMVLCIYCIIAVFLIPCFIVNAISCTVIDNLEENLQVNTQKNEEDNSSTEASNIILVIDYNDPLFENYSISYLLDQKYHIAESIVAKFKEPVENFNAIIDKERYEEYTRIAADYEIVYNLIRSKNLFREDISERLSYPSKIIYNRNNANNYLVTSENQRQTALRHKDWGDDYHFFKDSDNAILQYRNAIFWSMTALQTSYNETDPKIYNRDNMVKTIIDSYKEMLIITENDEKRQRISIMIEIFEYVEIQIK